MFVLTFAVLGLLLGLAEVYEPSPAVGTAESDLESSDQIVTSAPDKEIMVASVDK
jgi:hypothetical protein